MRKTHFSFQACLGLVALCSPASTRIAPFPWSPFPASAITIGSRTQPRTDRDAKNIKLELERGLSAEFKSLRRENEVLRRETAHKDSEVNDGKRGYALAESRPSLQPVANELSVVEEPPPPPARLSRERDRAIGSHDGGSTYQR